MKREAVDNDQSGRVYEDFQPRGAGWSHSGDSNTLIIDLPGFKNIKQLRLDVDRNLGNLHISGERHLAGNKWKRFRQVLRIPENSNSDEIQSRLEGGVLYVTIPKIIPPPKQHPPPAPSQEPKIGQPNRTVTIKKPTKVESVPDHPETKREDSPASAKTPALDQAAFFKKWPSWKHRPPVTRKVTFKEPTQVDAVEDPESKQKDSPAAAETTPAPEAVFKPPPSREPTKAPATRMLTFKEPTKVDAVEDPETEREDSPASATTPPPEAVLFKPPPSREPREPVTPMLTFKKPTKVDAVEDPGSKQMDSPAAAETTPAPEAVFKPPPSREPTKAPATRMLTFKEPTKVDAVEDPETEREDSPTSATTPAPEAVHFKPPPSLEPRAPVTPMLTFKKPTKGDAIEDPESEQEDSPAVAETTPDPEAAFEPPPSPVTRKLIFEEPRKVETVEDPEKEEENSPATWSGLVRILLEKNVIAFSMGVALGAFLGRKIKPRENRRNSN